MSITEKSRDAFIAEKSDYALIDKSRTTGLATLPTDINALNDYGMTPVQVALQAGAEDELDVILGRPGVEPLKLSTAGDGIGLFVQAYKENARSHADVEHVVSRMLKKLQEKVGAAPPAIKPGGLGL